ncbi:hypothetical protein J7K91_01820 [bacterium]|nr:hypothetical protein [bacterium]
MDEKILEEIKKIEPMVYLLIKMGEEKKGRKVLFKKARAGDKKVQRILEKAYHFKFVEPKEYLQEKEAEKKGFPIHFFRNLPLDLRKRLLKFEWKEIKEDFENLEKKVFPGIEKMEFLAKYGRDGVEILMEHFLEEKIEEKILEMLKKVKKIRRETEERIRKFLSALSLEDQRLFFKKIFFNLFDLEGYLQEKEAKKKGFPMHFFKSLPPEVRERVLKFKWKEIEEDFKNLEEKAFAGIRKMELLAKYGRNGMEILMDHFLLGLKEKIDEKILKMLKKVRKINIREEKKIKKILSNLSLEEQKLLFKKVFFNLSFFSRENLPSFKKEILEMEEEKIKNLVWQRKFGFLMIKGKFKKKRAKFPKIKTQLKLIKSTCPFYRVFLGEVDYQKAEIFLGKLSFKEEKPEREIVIKPYKFVFPYGWIFEMEGKKKYFCVRFHGIMVRLMEFNHKRILSDYLKGKVVPKKVDFLKEMEIHFRRIFFIGFGKRRIEMYFPPSYDGEKVKVKFKMKDGKLYISAFKGEKKIKEKIIEKV